MDSHPIQKGLETFQVTSFHYKQLGPIDLWIRENIFSVVAGWNRLGGVTPLAEGASFIGASWGVSPGDFQTWSLYNSISRN